MARSIPRWLTRRSQAHHFIGRLQNLQVRWAAWKDTRRVNKVLKRPHRG